MLISVITVVYNAEKTIEATVNSVLKEKNENVEYIVVDGKSTDKTVEILNKYSEQIDCLISEPDLGIYDAMNKGILKAKGEYIIFIQAGDTLRVGCINQIQKILERKQFALVYGNVYRLDTKEIYNGKYNKVKLASSNICQQAIFYNKKIFEQIGKHELKYKIHADYVLNLKCFGNSSIAKVYVDVVIANFEGNGYSAQYGRTDKSFYCDIDNLIFSNLGYKAYLHYVFCVKLKRIIILGLEKTHLKRLLKNLFFSITA